MASQKYVYLFGRPGKKKADGSGKLNDLLGNKGAQLAEMCQLGLPVPAGLTGTTEACNYYLKKGCFPPGFKKQVKEGVAEVGRIMDLEFGQGLLFSARSGAAVSMPGMMDTVLNIGINDEIAQKLIAHYGDEAFVYDLYRRFIQMYADVVMYAVPENEPDPFKEIMARERANYEVALERHLPPDTLWSIIQRFKKIVRERTGQDIPTDPWDQLWSAIKAVFNSWNVPRAVQYRHDEGLADSWGTAVNTQAMVYGNLDDQSGTLVAFTRDPSTGEKKPWGEFLQGQGEDVVAGTYTPKELNELKRSMPEVYEELLSYMALLEGHCGDMQDIEATIQTGKLWMLQTRTGKRTANAAIRIAAEMEQEGLIDQKTILARVTPEQVESALHSQVDPKISTKPIVTGVAASPGAVCGKVVFDPHRARDWTKRDKIILVSAETTADDVHGFREGVLTKVGGKTSHAAVVARGRNIPAVTGCEEIEINRKKRYFKVGSVKVHEGDLITLDGTNGCIYLGAVPLVVPELSKHFYHLLEIATTYKQIGVRANADTPAEARKAREFGAEGIGLCRTEHMFLLPERVRLVRLMILTEEPSIMNQAKNELYQMQKQDFLGIFRAMDGLPVVIRLIDPPLHEFLRINDPTQRKELAVALGISDRALRKKIGALQEINPMLGHRGVRLGITHSEIPRMQTMAITAAAVLAKREGVDVHPEIMVPLVGHVSELVNQKKVIRDGATFKGRHYGDEVPYHIGTMIEVPRACLVADKIAREADFFSFGTNDLTQMTLGYSRDDAEKGFLPHYLKHGILQNSPFQTLDQEGVGSLMRIAVEKGKQGNPNLTIGICGEHGGDPRSIAFCHHMGLNYVSCSAPRVPVALVAAARVALGID